MPPDKGSLYGISGYLTVRMRELCLFKGTSPEARSKAMPVADRAIPERYKPTS